MWLQKKGPLSSEPLSIRSELLLSLPRLDLDGRPVLCPNTEGSFQPGATLLLANLSGANLAYKKLEKADLRYADLTNAKLMSAKFKGADLSKAVLLGADLAYADLTDAVLYGANLREATLDGTMVDGAVFGAALLHDAVYTPNPEKKPSARIEAVEGVENLKFPRDRESGVAALRAMFRDQGLRRLERAATYAIESNRAERGDILGLLSRVFVGLPTGWGLHPNRAWVVFAAIAAGTTMCYAVAIHLQTDGGRESRIVRVYPSGRLAQTGGNITIEKDSLVKPVVPGGCWVIVGWALYFAFLSGFHIGWRDLNVGTWIARIQPREFFLRGYGWVRVVSGIQSLVSVYLIAIWALTQFGRPFD